jgi:hypothetical protein
MKVKEITSAEINQKNPDEFWQNLTIDWHGAEEEAIEEIPGITKMIKAFLPLGKIYGSSTNPPYINLAKSIGWNQRFQPIIVFASKKNNGNIIYNISNGHHRLAAIRGLTRGMKNDWARGRLQYIITTIPSLVIFTKDDA